jgi:hypothetical protein
MALKKQFLGHSRRVRNQLAFLVRVFYRSKLEVPINLQSPDLAIRAERQEIVQEKFELVRIRLLWRDELLSLVIVICHFLVRYMVHLVQGVVSRQCQQFFGLDDKHEQTAELKCQMIIRHLCGRLFWKLRVLNDVVLAISLAEDADLLVRAAFHAALETSLEVLDFGKAELERAQDSIQHIVDADDLNILEAGDDRANLLVCVQRIEEGSITVWRHRRLVLRLHNYPAIVKDGWKLGLLEEDEAVLAIPVVIDLLEVLDCFVAIGA